MGISEGFAMGGTGGGDNYGNSDYHAVYGEGSEDLDDPRLRRHGLREIIGTRRYGGSGLSALFTKTRD